MTYKKREFTGSESDKVLANFYMSEGLGIGATVLPSGYGSTAIVPDCFKMPAPVSRWTKICRILSKLKVQS